MSVDRFNIFSENMVICLDGSYSETEAIEKAKEQSKTTSVRWIVHDNTGKPHYVAVRGEIFALSEYEPKASAKLRFRVEQCGKQWVISFITPSGQKRFASMARNSSSDIESALKWDSLTWAENVASIWNND